MDREVTHAIPTAERVSGRLLDSAMDREVKHAIPTTESDPGRNDDSRPGGEASDRDDGRTERRPPRMFRRRKASKIDDVRRQATTR